jgi:hypothetical protein
VLVSKDDLVERRRKYIDRQIELGKATDRATGTRCRSFLSASTK